ncbi:MAG: WYL domain-containing transcriptional regulator [Spirosoma sp.]|nr:WYL domain-containing transcriptional regulator [Spirosoma sp.]
MSAQPHLLRLLTFLRLLTNRPGLTIAQAAIALDTTPRTVYRYLETLHDLGYLTDKDEHDRYFLFEADRATRPAFTANESALVVQLLASLPPNHALTDSIRRKLYLTSDLVPLADELQERHQGLLVERLAGALERRQQVQLVRYHSPSSNTITDRLIEPLEFTDHYATLKAIDTADGREKSFKIRRMTDVLVLNTPCAATAGQTEIVDAFDWPGAEPLLIVLNLDHLAYRLMHEERPRTRPFLAPQPNPDFPYRFRGEVRSYIGIGRFVLGLPGHINVLESAGFRNYLQERIELGGY